MKLLLTSVFGPYGVDNEFGRKENKMELFHNQVTREQGIFSYRFNHSSFGLYFLAENIDVPTTILDFPTLDTFINEIKKGYEYVGISFIIPNYKKAKEMTRLVRKHAPNSKIILGGHGVNIPEIETLLESDYICKGEGVRFLRKLFNEDPDKPIKHPLAHSSFNRHVMGVALPQASGVLIPGVGCANKCRFCATSHFFGEYTPYLATGKDVFDICSRYEKELGITDFGVLDENFMKMKDRALELIELMEKNNKFYTFGIFSSAETLMQLDNLDVLVRLGVQFIWIGVESKKEIYEKNKGIDFHNLIMELKNRGISVLTSAILFLEHHDKETIWEDIDFAISLKPDYLQFMELGPVPGTALYADYESQDKILKEVDYEEQHGQDKIWFKHEHFTRDETTDCIKQAFKKDYSINGASFLRVMQTTLQGYNYAKNHKNEYIRNRAKGTLKLLSQLQYFVFASRFFKRNKGTKVLLKNVRQGFRNVFPVKSIKTRILSVAVLALACKEMFRIKFIGDVRQPKHSKLSIRNP
jgi:radical SAM superfamily enzyme YgiQ (UPF0313 family)